MQTSNIVDELKLKFGESELFVKPSADGIPTVWVPKEKIIEILRFCKNNIHNPYKMLYDITAIDERSRADRAAQPESDFTVVYHFFSFGRNEYLRIKTALKEQSLFLPSITGLWLNADWYEREIYDMFGVEFKNHPHLRRILMPPTWIGYPLRKEHPARATEMGPFQMPDDKWEEEEASL
ncbi:MAG: NADH-quinone oxidoreductase subunit C, partial [Ignavibacteria bacterium]